MNDIIKTYQERFRRSRYAFRRYAALLLALAMITTLFVNWQLHGVGISMTADYQCGETEHTHTASCYTRMLVCGYNEGELENPDQVAGYAPSDPGTTAGDSGIALYDTQEPLVEWVPHEHTDDCYTEVQTLTCMEEEHTHDDDCFDPEDGSLICNKFEHTHDESCYTTELELTCGLQEGELVEQEVEPTQSAALFAMAAAQPVVTELPVDTVEPVYHHHTDDCYEEVLTCPFPEHHHTVNCLGDTEADIETEEEWLAKTDTNLDGLWADDLITVAQSQLGYEQSERNFQLDGDDQVTVRHYTRYGQSYGNAYGEWDVMFLSYCLKYAQIPQAAVPQQAGVLALRSAMKGMTWLHDVDGTAAVPGDIVIYQKQATRTVAVSDAQPEDLYTENSAAVQDMYGIAALPADSTTAKPVDVGDFVPAAPADTEQGSVPQTASETDIVDTVGIVTAIDEETGTLTVISGDVDGKVAEVQLAPAEVQSVIGVTEAQTALSGKAGFTTLEGNTQLPHQYKDSFTETKGADGKADPSKGGVYDYEISVDNIKYGDNTDLTVGKTANLKFKYKIEAGVLSKTTDGGNVLHYKLPEGLEPPQEITRTVFDLEGRPIGQQVFHTNGTSEITFDTTQEYVDIEKAFEGVFAYDWTYTNTSTSTDTKITFPGSSTTITLKKQQDLSIQKKSGGITEVNGKPTIHYTIEVTTQNGWDTDDITIKDTLSLTNASTLGVKFKDFTLKKFAKDAATGTDVSFTEPTPQKRQNESKYDFEIKDLPHLEAGEKYVLEYDVELTNTSGKGWQEIGNQAFVSGGGQSQWSSEVNADHLKKEGTYNKDDGTITWTVWIYNPNGADLDGDVVKDTVKTAGSQVKGNVKLIMTKDENGTAVNQELESFAPNTNKDGFSYTFDKTKISSTKGKEYKFVYTTTVPADATNVSNDAEYERGESKYTDGTNVGITDNVLSVKKSATASGLTESTSHTGLREAAWQIDVALPRSAKQNTIADWFTSNGNGNTVDHFAYAKDLQSQIESNLKISYQDTDGSTKWLTYQELENEGVKFTIGYYNNLWDRREETKVDPTDGTTKVYSFTIEVDTTNYTGSQRLLQLSLPYTTLVDTSQVKEGDKIGVTNTANNVSANYEYTKPSTNVRIVKGSWDAGNANRETGSYFGGTNATAKVDYNNKYIGYQVVLDLSSLDELGIMTLTDILPKGVAYIKDSTSISFGKQNSITSGATEHTMELPTTDGGTYKLWDHWDAFEPTVAASTDPDKGDTLTFSWDWASKKIDFAKLKNQGKYYLALRYKVSFTDDERWQDRKTDTIPYENKITYNYNDNISASSTTNVNRTTEILKKSSEQIFDTDQESRVRYTVVINPAGKTLGSTGEITLTDVLTVMSPNVQAELKLDSVKLYNYPKNEHSTPLDPTSYSFKAPVQGTNSKNQYTYTMSFTLKDETPYVLEYDYVTDAAAAVMLRNDAQLSTGAKSYTQEEYIAVGGQSTIYQKKLIVHKVDSRNDTVHLNGAQFSLEYFDLTQNDWKNTGASYDTGADGKVTFWYVKSNAQDDQVTSGRLYRLKETRAPDGYQVDTNYHYFLYWDGTQQQLDAYNAALGSYANGGAGDAAAGIPAKADVTFYRSDMSTNDLYVRDVANSLTIYKYWTDVSGYPVQGSDAPLSQVTVKLYKHLDGTTPDPATDAEVATITLTKDDNWTYTYSGTNGEGLEAGYLYYIVEQYTGTRFAVSYGPENTNGVGAGGVLTVTNKDTGVKEYELPSTGGTGTLPFTLAGGTMMLLALAYGVRRKRRHEGRVD